MKVLVISTLYPNAAQPVHAMFVKNMVNALSKQCDVSLIAPVPMFPFVGWMKKYRLRSSIPKTDIIDGIKIRYLRFLSIPRFLKPLDGFFLFLSLLVYVGYLRKDSAFELIHANLAYPDGFAAVLAGIVFKKPIVVTLRGHEINDLPKYPVRKRQVNFVLNYADRIIAVAEALKLGAVRMGGIPEKIRVITNGIDRQLFYPLPQTEARRRTGLPLERKVVLSVGHLVERKGFHTIIASLGHIKQSGMEVPLLVIVGGPGEEGDFSGELKRQIAQLGEENNVLMVGPKSNADLVYWYCSADIFCLASSKEGRANVLLESLSCGIPVVATNVWGTPEIISESDYGLLVERDSQSISQALISALSKPWDKDKILKYARSRSWDDSAKDIYREFQAAQKAYSQDLFRTGKRSEKGQDL